MLITLVICYKRMWKKFCNWLLYKHLGWTKNVTVDHPSKYIICLAPHTSNWDMPLGQAYAGAEGMRINFLMKKEWFFWPLGPMFKRMGGIPVWRSKHTSMTDQLAQTAIRGHLPSVHHTRGHTLEKRRLEEGLLLYSTESQNPHTALWCGL